MAEQFLTLMAVLDDESQKTMTRWYDELRAAGFKGKQTPDIPYHISLGSFSLEKESEVVQEMKKLACEFEPIPVYISHIGIFSGGEVLFGAPDIKSTDILSLHEAIHTETIDRFAWTPHVTLLMDEPKTVQNALGVFVEPFQPFCGRITRLQLCAFWPTREIAEIELNNHS